MTLYEDLVRVAYNNPELRDDLMPLIEEHKPEARFEKGKPADPTERMSPEDAEKWEEMNEEHGDKFKDASSESEIQSTVDDLVSEFLRVHKKYRKAIKDLPTDEARKYIREGRMDRRKVQDAKETLNATLSINPAGSGHHYKPDPHDLKRDWLAQIVLDNNHWVGRAEKWLQMDKSSIEDDWYWGKMDFSALEKAVRALLELHSKAERKIKPAMREHDKNDLYDIITSAVHKDADSSKVARSLFKEIVDYRALYKLVGAAERAEDKQTADSLREIMKHFLDLFELEGNEERAFNRLNNLISRQPEPDDLRNQVAKIADLLGLDTPLTF